MTGDTVRLVDPGFAYSAESRLLAHDGRVFFTGRYGYGELYARAWRAALRLFRKGLELDGVPIPAVLRDGDDAPRYDLDAEVPNPDWYPAARADRAA